MTAPVVPRGKRRVRTPTILQMEMVECGAAALGIVLAYWGRRVPLEELRVACGVSRDGSKASNIVRAARDYGLEAKGMRREVAEVLEGTLPVVIFWNFNHFVVLEGTSRDRVFINDPAMGPRSVSRGEFDEAFTGVSLEFAPTPEFRHGGPSSGLSARLWARLGGLRPAIGFIAWVSLMLVIPGLLLPGLTAVFVDNVLVQRFEGWLSPLLVGLGAAFVLNFLLTLVQGLALLRLELRLAFDQSARFVWHLLRLPMDFFGQRVVGDLVNRVDANDNVASLLGHDIGGALAHGFTTLFIGLIMVFYDPVLATIVFIGVGLNLLVLRLVNRGLSDVTLRLQVEQGRLFGTSVTGLRSIETLKATGGENDFFSRWAGYHARAINSEQRLALYLQFVDVLPGLILSLVSVAVLCVGATRVVDGYMTLGMLVAFQSLLSGFIGPVGKLVGVGAKMREASADFARLEDVLHYRRDWRFADRPPVEANEPAAGHLSLLAVSFGYSPLAPPLIEGFSLDVAPGRWVALVGASGSGKSTLGKLIAGLQEPRSGEIRIDGRLLSDWGRDRLSDIIAVVDQDIRLFAGTVHDNVTLWDDTVPHDRLVAAIDDAGLAEAVSRLDGSYHARLSEDGANLNAGQRQRLEIARALARAPALLILDEATASLDAVSEKTIFEAVRRRGMTCVLIAHRLSTVRDCDEIIVLDRGKVIERGTHAALMARSGAYADLVRVEGIA